jgi:DNA-binding transcriptional LysR family regulator
LEIPVELRHIRYFIAVAEELNFTRAAARVGIGQPPLSQQIRDLEDELGTPLFHRVPHGAELTEAGKAFLPEARAILLGAERARLAAQRAYRGEAGTLSLGFTSSAAFNLLVSTTIRTFRRRWPGIILSLDETNTIRLLERLGRGELDVGFIRPGVQDPQDVRLKRLPDEPMLIALPARHELASRERLPLSALAKDPFVLFPRTTGLSLYDEVVSACRACGFEPVVVQEAPQIASVVNLVAAELGVSIVPASISQIRLKGVTYRPIEGVAPIARLALAYRRGWQSPAVRNLLGLLPQE